MRFTVALGIILSICDITECGLGVGVKCDYPQPSMISFGLICIMQSNQIPICVNSGNIARCDREILAMLILLSSYSAPTTFCDLFHQICY